MIPQTQSCWRICEATKCRTGGGIVRTATDMADIVSGRVPNEPTAKAKSGRAFREEKA